MSQHCETQVPEKPRRMLGQVELAVHGPSRKPEMAQALMNAIALSEKLTGQMSIAYPAHVDAVLVSDHGQVTVIDLNDGGPATDDAERQDRAFVAVERLMRMEPALMTGRKTRVSIQTITLRRGIGPINPDDSEHPVVNISTARGALETFQENPPQGVDVDKVIAQLLWMPQTN